MALCIEELGDEWRRFSSGPSWVPLRGDRIADADNAFGRNHILVGGVVTFLRRIFPAAFMVGVPVSFLVTVILIFVFWKPSAEFLRINKDPLTAFGSIIAGLSFLYALAISFIKFSASGLFSLRMQISISTSKANISDDVVFHLIRIVLTNPGSLPLRIREIVLKSSDYIEENLENHHSIENLSCIKDHVADGFQQKITGGQESVYYVTRKMSKNVKIVTYEAVVRDFMGSVWTDMVLVKNAD